jgi:hypothetical protein
MVIGSASGTYPAVVVVSTDAATKSNPARVASPSVRPVRATSVAQIFVIAVPTTPGKVA